MNGAPSTPPTLSIATTFFATAGILCLLSLPFLLFLGLKFAEDLDLQPYLTATHPMPVQPPPTPQGDEPQGRQARTAPQPKPWYQDPNSRPYRMITAFAIFSAAALFGALGAVISALTRGIGIVSGPVISTAAQLIGLELVGAVFATILALVFAGGLIQGSLFPQSRGYSWPAVMYIHSEFAKLLVWSFLIGFSERLMPQLLDVFADRFSGTASGSRPDGEEHRDV